ncbi:MAG: glycine dehydrogenase, partial [Phycisphaerales bacterium JB038]
MDYTQITPEEQREMLATIGVEDVDSLFAAIPEDRRFQQLLDLPPARSELELQRDINNLAWRNLGTSCVSCFLGGGAYDHFIPAFIDQLISRGEFLTAYTPYQAEASQGALQAFFEFQTQIARLTGMDIANASLYEGATAVAEAVHLALNHTGKRRVLLAESLHPDYRRVVKTYLSDLPVECVEIPVDAETGKTDAAALARELDDDVACVAVQSPNFLG